MAVNTDILSVLRAKQTSPFDFNFDMLMAPPLACLVHPQDGWDIYELCRSLKYASKLDYKLRCIDQIMRSRGFVKMLAGTNRVIYRYLEDDSFLLKIPFDRSAMNDNINEFNNQFKLKPFVPKTFEVHPSGSIALVERVKPIRRMYEFMEVADDIFDVITGNFIGKYVLEDIGTKYFMNWGIRANFGVVLLDYPYCYELDGNKLYCNNVDMSTGIVCNGVIDYDYGFNELRCPVCGKRYTAKDLESAISQRLIVVKGEYKMKVQLVRGNEVIADPMASSDIIERPKAKKKHEPFVVTIVKDGKELGKISLPNQNKDYRFDEPELPVKTAEEIIDEVTGQKTSAKYDDVNYGESKEDVVKAKYDDVNYGESKEDVVEATFDESIPEENSEEISSKDFTSTDEAKTAQVIPTLSPIALDVDESIPVTPVVEDKKDDYAERANQMMSEIKGFGPKRHSSNHNGIMDKFINPDEGIAANVEITEASDVVTKKSVKRHDNGAWKTLKRGPDGRFLKKES